MMRTLLFFAATGALIAIACALVGCGGGTKPPPPGSATLDIGTANTDGTGFLALTGDTTMVPGAQGGFHVWIKYRIEGMAPATINVHRESHRVSDNALVLLTDGTLDVGAPGDDGWWEMPMAQPSFMCPTPIGINVIDERIVFDVSMTAMDGTPLASSTAEATVHCPDGDQNAFCVKICSG